MKPLAVVLALALAPQAWATGLATCDSGPEEGWQDKDVLQKQLESEGWEVRRVKVDGGCYEVYAKNADGERVEAYFHPVTLEPVPIEDDHEE
ncbi:PepSY domain-containing protein [Marinihelvus fidelis]|uniref:PepSY domain-containing protein n=1 Tax=Marinihelvus fidelis TaxID=2613842 RepID=A0A5N0TGQ0_9GAMM|nr:PepSY domain-containing protein [Marinihelvus fidelis]